MRNRRLIRILIPMTLMVLAIMLATSFSYAASVQNAKGKVNSASGAMLRAKASITSSALSLLNDNTEVTIIKEVFTDTKSTRSTDKWYYVKNGSVKGYIRSDLIDSVTYTAVKGKITGKVNYRVGPGTLMTKKGSLKKGKAVTVYLKASPVASTKGSSATWYKIKVGSAYRYVSSTYVKITGLVSKDNNKDEQKDDVKQEDQKQDDQKQEQKEDQKDQEQEQTQPLSDAEFETYLTSQGFPETYKTKLRELHKSHPNWAFIAYDTKLSWDAVVKAESKTGYCVIHKTQPVTYRSTETGDYDSEKDSWKSKTWYTANSQTISYYLDPRNFLTSDRAYMFEQLSYNGEYQTESIVDLILTSKLKAYGFTADIFVDAGKTNNISPIHIASRATSENGAGSIMVDGSGTYNDQTVYNPFNIGASDSNPINGGLKTAYTNGWFTPVLAVNGGANYIAKNYINCKQDTSYFQKFNVANGSKYLATHQYMTNLLAPYNEAGSTRTAYSRYGITEKTLSFLIPIYENMPESTNLPS